MKKNKSQKSYLKILLIILVVFILLDVGYFGWNFYQGKKQIKSPIKNQQENQIQEENLNETNDVESTDNNQGNVASGDKNNIPSGWVTKNINNWFTGNGDEVKLSILIPSDYSFYLFEDYSYRIGEGSAGRIWSVIRLQDCSDNKCEFVTYKNRYENGDINISNIKNKNGIDFYLYNTGGDIGPNYCYAYSEKISIAFSGWDLDVPCNDSTFRTMLNSIVFN